MIAGFLFLQGYQKMHRFTYKKDQDQNLWGRRKLSIDLS